MNHAQTNQDFCDLTLRIDKLIWLAVSNIDYALPDDLKELLDEEDYEMLSELFGLPLDEMKESEWDSDLIAESLIDYRKFGFLVQAATPVREYVAKNTWQSGWGYFNTKWLYAETLEDALQAAKDWAESMHRKAESAFDAKGGAA